MILLEFRNNSDKNRRLRRKSNMFPYSKITTKAGVNYKPRNPSPSNNLSPTRIAILTSSISNPNQIIPRLILFKLSPFNSKTISSVTGTITRYLNSLISVIVTGSFPAQKLKTNTHSKINYQVVFSKKLLTFWTLTQTEMNLKTEIFYQICSLWISEVLPPMNKTSNLSIHKAILKPKTITSISTSPIVNKLNPNNRISQISFSFD